MNPLITEALSGINPIGTNVISPRNFKFNCDITQDALDILRTMWRDKPVESMKLTKYLCSMDLLIKELIKNKEKKDIEISVLRNRLMLIDAIDKEMIDNEIEQTIKKNIYLCDETKSKI